MTNASGLGRCLVTAFVALALAATIHQAAHTGHGQEPGSPAGGPLTTDPLRSIPFDRITLSDGMVLIVDPVSPRPLPTPEQIKDTDHGATEGQQDRGSL